MRTKTFEPSILPKNTELPEYGVICSHIDRVRRFARTFLENAKLITQVRGYEVYIGDYQGSPVFIAYVGIGAPSASILIEELIALGAKEIIRVGTNDNPTEDPNDRTIYLLEGSFEAHFAHETTSDTILNQQILRKADALGIAVAKTKSMHVDFYYHVHNPIRFAEYPEEVLMAIHQAKLDGIEIRDMESSALFYLGKLRGIKTSTLLHTILRHSVEHEYSNVLDLETEHQCGVLALESLRSEVL